jgi:hypothetical protein
LAESKRNVISLKNFKRKDTPKEWATKTLHKIYRILRKDPDQIFISLLQMEEDEGYIEYGLGDEGPEHSYCDIYIDPRGAIISTCIHEFLHFIYPDLLDPQILKLEEKMMNNLSDRQFKNLLFKIVNCII